MQVRQGPLGGTLTAAVISVKMEQSAETRRFYTVSEELPELHISGRTREALQEELPHAIKALLEAKGHTVIVVRAEQHYAEVDRLPFVWMTKETACKALEEA